MLARVAGWLARLAYGVLVLVVFAAASYFAFNLFVRSGVTTVPDLVGGPDTAVDGLLADSGLRSRRNREIDRFDEEMPRGHVLEQSPGAGSLVKRGAAVEVIVSLGPERLRVPDVQGRALQAAQVTLTSSGLTLGRIANVYSQSARPGTIVLQDPAPGSQASRGAPVALFLAVASHSDTYVMPDLAYRDYERVRHFFDARGFRLGSIKFEPYEGIAPGVILRQYPLAGHPLGRQDVISLVVTAID